MPSLGADAADGSGSGKSTSMEARHAAAVEAVKNAGSPGGRRGIAPKSRKDKFPVKLMDMLSTDDFADCITWLPHGRSFVISSPERFTDTVLPRYFKECKFSSFTRKLYRWGFRQISKGPDAESFFHKYFRRDKKNMCNMIVCGREVRDGCPELHEGINSQSLQSMERAELRDSFLRQKHDAAMRAQALLRQQGMSQQPGPSPPAPHIPALNRNNPHLAASAHAAAAAGMASRVGVLAHAPSPARPKAVVGALRIGGATTHSARDMEMIQAASLGGVFGVNQLAAVAAAGGPSPGVHPGMFSQQRTALNGAALNGTALGAEASAAASALALTSSGDPAEVQTRIDLLQARILDLKRRQLAELESKHAELAVLEAGGYPPTAPHGSAPGLLHSDAYLRRLHGMPPIPGGHAHPPPHAPSLAALRLQMAGGGAGPPHLSTAHGRGGMMLPEVGQNGDVIAEDLARFQAAAAFKQLMAKGATGATN